MILPEDRWWAAEPKWRAAEEYGFDHAWTYDHLGWRNLVDGPWFSAIPTLTAAAGVTSRIGLGTFVATPNFRHPLPFMRELLTLDDISDGRALVGLGAGTAPPSYDAVVLGERTLSAGERVDRFAEFTESLDGLLRIDKFDYEGSYYAARGARNLPGGVQRPRPPFVVAANGPRTMGLAARFGDAWLTTGRAAETLDEWWAGVEQLSHRFATALDEHGRGHGDVRRYLSLDAAPVYSLSSVQAFRDAAARAGELGFTDIVVHWPRGGEPYEGREPVLEEVAETILPELQQS